MTMIGATYQAAITQRERPSKEVNEKCKVFQEGAVYFGYPTFVGRPVIVSLRKRIRPVGFVHSRRGGFLEKEAFRDAGDLLQRGDNCGHVGQVNRRFLVRFHVAQDSRACYQFVRAQRYHITRAQLVRKLELAF